MKPPVAPQSESQQGPPAAFVCLDVLKNRSDFLAAAKGRRAASPSINLQGRQRGDEKPARVGFTATKKVGNAVARNRAKRRLRAVAESILNEHGRNGWDYVLVARPDVTASRPWEELQKDLLDTLARVHS